MRSWSVDNKFLRDNDLTALKAFLATRPHERGIVLGIAYTGLRVSEAVSLSVRNLDLPGKRLVVVEGKGGKTGTVLLSDDAVEHFQGLIQGKQPDEPVFSTRWGKRYSVRGIQKVVEKVFRALGMPFSTHSLRHTYCTRLILALVPITTVKENMRHSSIAVTDVYAHCMGKLDIKKLY